MIFCYVISSYTILCYNILCNIILYIFEKCQSDRAPAKSMKHTQIRTCKTNKACEAGEEAQYNPPQPSEMPMQDPISISQQPQQRPLQTVTDLLKPHIKPALTTMIHIHTAVSINCGVLFCAFLQQGPCYFTTIRGLY